MTLKDAIKQHFGKYKKGEVSDMESLKRDFLLKLSSFEVPKDEYKTAVCCMLEGMNGTEDWQVLKREMHDCFLLDIGEETEPKIVESYWCYLNLATNELTAKKSLEAYFLGQADYIVIDDYRQLKGVSWKDLIFQ